MFQLLLVIRKTTNIYLKKKSLLTATLFFTYRLPEETCKHPFRCLPVFPVDTVFYFRSFNLPLNESGFFQFLQMLRHCSLGYGQFFMNVTEKTTLLGSQKLKYGNACRMPHRLGETGYLLLFFGILLFHHFLCLYFIVRKITNNIFTDK